MAKLPMLTFGVIPGVLAFAGFGFHTVPALILVTLTGGAALTGMS